MKPLDLFRKEVCKDCIGNCTDTDSIRDCGEFFKWVDKKFNNIKQKLVDIKKLLEQT